MDHLPMPKFGPLAGLRVVFSGIEIAGPFAGQMFAEWGAEVIWIENVAWADTIRVQPNYPQLSRRNLHALSLNIFKDEGREAFLKLMETTDIFIEASKGPAFARRGITDEVLWQHNPKLVIAHLSGFGQYGTEEYTNLPAYNTIAQAFSGYLIQNGDVDQPMPAFPYTADYFSGLTATTAVLAAMLVGRFTALMIDGWVGLVVACFILFSGYQAAKETLGPLLGQPPEQELVERIRQMVLSHPPICGIHDLVVHDYGPGRMMVSLHAEVPAHGDILELHDVIDTAEMELKRTLHCDAVIHMDPIVTDDAQIVQLRRRVAELVGQVDSGMTIHDFRVVPGPSHTNLIFDAVLPFGEHITEAEAARQIRERVRQMDEGEYYAVVTVENPYV